jgi:hypothetical protein
VFSIAGWSFAVSSVRKIVTSIYSAQTIRRLREAVSLYARMYSDL